MRDSLVDRESIERLLLFNGAIRAGLIDALAREGARSAKEVAQIAGADPRAVGVVLEALAAEGVAERVTGNGLARYRLSELGWSHLVDSGPDLERSSLLHLANRVRGWLDLPEVIRTGEPLQKDPARRDVRSFVSAMGEREPEFLEEIVERCLTFSGPIRTMIDIGGAVGHVARQFSRCGVRATLLDRESVEPIARQFLGEAGADIAFVGADFIKSLPPGPFDLAYLGNVLHIYGPPVVSELIGNVYAILSAGGTIAIQDHVWERSPRAAMFAVNMLQATKDGGVWTEEQYRGWLAGAGFSEVEIADLDTTWAQVILGRKPKPAPR
ncbi:MAG: acetylserotonin O-methyltransferase [Actinobacteria bacterium]|nr:acetylserotonin O-methyltransferase [Actinomycetota bacterium]